MHIAYAAVSTHCLSC